MEEKVIKLLNSVELEAIGDVKLVANDLMKNKSIVEVQKAERQIVVCGRRNKVVGRDFGGAGGSRESG